MSPAPRKPLNRGLPPRLYQSKDGRFRYLRPDGVTKYLGFERGPAVEAAKAANAYFSKKTDLYSKIIASDTKTLSTVIDDYLRDKLPKYEIGEETRKNREYRLRKIQQASIANEPIEEITTRGLYIFLETMASDWSRQAYRAMLITLFSWAIQTGLRDDNPAVALERPSAKRLRQRLSLDHFQKIRDKAPAWLQRLMDLQLQTAQRPGDVVMMKWSEVTTAGLQVTQRKTGKKLILDISPPLRAVLDQCRDDVPSPFLIHRRPEKLRPQHMRAKTREHWTQVLLEQAERAFDEAREATGLYKPSDAPPTLHEIRSLAAHLYEEIGWPKAQVQALLGHSEAAMTEHYQKGHERKAQMVAAGLNLLAI